MILLLDNYDSFTYNLYQFIAGVESKRGDMQKDQIDSEVKVIRNDQITPEEILELAPEALVISPGPGKPSDAGICIEAIQKLKEKYQGQLRLYERALNESGRLPVLKKYLVLLSCREIVEVD